MTSIQEYPIQATGFWVFGFLSVVVAVLKLTVAGYWSWWRVMLPSLAFLGHNPVYLLVAVASKIGWMVINLRNCPIKQQFS